MTRITTVCVAVLGLAACGDEQPVSCSEDFDCKVGQICKSGICAGAGAGTERNFGRVELDFATGAENYLLSVFNLPRDEGTADDQVAFTLSAGGGGGALRVAPLRNTYALSAAEEAYWRDRIAFESERHAGIDRLITDIRAGRRASVISATRQTCPCTGATVCDGGVCAAMPTFTLSDAAQTTVNCTVLGETTTAGGVKVVILIDQANNTGGNAAAAQAAATAFRDSAASVLAFLGKSGHGQPLDQDGDGRVAVIFSEKLTSIQGGSVAGYFAFQDFLAGGANSNGNAIDVLWSRVPTADTMQSCSPVGCGTVTHELAVGTLVHEYTHLVTFATRVAGRAGAVPADNEVMWLDEGVAHLMEDLTGWGASNMSGPALALSEWPLTGFAGPSTSGADSPARRGMAYALLRHIIDEQATVANAGGVTAANTSLLKNLLADSERGFRHAVFQDRGADGVWHWLLAAFATGNPQAIDSAAQAHNYLPTVTGAQNQQKGFNPYATVTDARGRQFDLVGPTLGDGSLDEITDLSAPYESQVTLSGGLLFMVTGFAEATAITGRGDAQVDLQIRAVRVW